MKIEELEKEINDIEETLNNLKIKVEELKKNKNSFEPTPKGWEPKHKEKYWIAHYNLKPTVFFNDEEYLNEPIIKYNRTFKTKEECQLYDCLFSVQHKDIYFDSKKTIENLINKFGEENVKRYYLEVYWMFMIKSLCLSLTT